MQKLRTEELIVRTIKQEDFDAIVDVDAQVSGVRRPDYYRRKFQRALDTSDRLQSDYVALHQGRVVGFIMGDVFMGEFGIPETTASIDTIGVDPQWQGSGVASLLFETFLTAARKSGVERIQTLVNWKDWDLLKFFASFGFSTSGTLHLKLDLLEK
ncbi:MAG: GNAT family N-acetyltransferase [bacterium]